MLISCISFFFFFLATPRSMRDLPRPGMEPMPTALGAQSLNHGTAREVQYHVPVEMTQ